MSLDFNLTGIENYEQVCWIYNAEGERERLNPVTDVIILSTMMTGIGHITDKNIDEYAARYRIIEKLNGPFLRREGEEYCLTDEEIFAHIGLVCNVRNETRAEWTRRLFANKQTSITDEYRHAFRRLLVKEPVNG